MQVDVPSDQRSQGGEGSRREGTEFVVVAASILVGLGLKAALILSGVVPFNSDEAIVGLMARHILEGAWPIFFYGQAYMGSLDAWLIAGMFRLFNPGVVWIRAVQALLYALFLLTSWRLAEALFPERKLGRWAVALGAVPPVLITLYTTATLGGYGEFLVLGNLCLLLGIYAFRRPERAGAWGLLGFAGGIGFWTMGSIVVYLIPLGVLYLFRLDRTRAWLTGGLLASLGFLIGSAPWWIYNWLNSGAALAELVTYEHLPSTLGQRLLGFVILGIPALLGMRPPWSGEFIALPILFLATLLYSAVVLHLVVRYQDRRATMNLGAKLLLGMTAVFVLSFWVSGFGIDSTGRYMLPLYFPLLIACAYLLERAWRWRRTAALLGLSGFLLVNGWGTAAAAFSPSRITTQFDPISNFDNRHDRVLIEFLEEQGAHTGYTNYWVAYRIAFLTAEDIQLSPELPYKRDLRFTVDDIRLPQYKRRADASDEIVYVTTLHPELDRRLRRSFRSAGVEFEETEIGPYRVFYDFSSPIRPDAIRPTLSP